jgi:HPr kinase/phosphorylase
VGANRLVHATTVAIDGRAVLLRGPSGAGKSDLALRLIDAGGCLIADDQSELRRVGAALLVRAPANLFGLIEVRGIGIVRMAAVSDVRLALVADLVPADSVERLPPARNQRFLGLDVPLVAIAPFEASAPAKLRAALDALSGPASAMMLDV